MLDWLLLLCILILVLFIWPGAKYLGTEGPPGAFLQSQAPSRQGSDDPPAGTRVSDGGEVALICKPSALANYLLRHCRAFRDYAPCVGWTWRASALLQSAYEACWPCRSPVQFVRDNLQLSDDGLVALDWAVPPSHRRRRTSSHSTSPVLLVIPNSFGKITGTVLKVGSPTPPHPTSSSKNGGGDGGEARNDGSFCSLAPKLPRPPPQYGICRVLGGDVLLVWKPPRR